MEYGRRCWQHPAIFDLCSGIKVGLTVRKIIIVVSLEITELEVTCYVKKLEEKFGPKVPWMYKDGEVEVKIPSLVRVFGFSIERDSLFLNIHLRRTITRLSKKCDALLWRSSKTNLRLAMSMK